MNAARTIKTERASPVANVRAPLQERSRQAFERIFGAAEALLNERAFDQIAVADIAEKANVSVGSVYQRFKTKDDLLWALYENYLREAEEVFEALENAKATEENKIGALISCICNLFSKRRGVARSLLFKYRDVPDVIPKAFIKRIEDIYAIGVRQISEQSSLPATEERVVFAFSLIVTTCREEFLVGDSRRLLRQRKTPDTFVKMLENAVLGALNTGHADG